MEPMTYEKAKEMLKPYEMYEKFPFYELDRLMEAYGFVKGWDARGKEVEILKDEISRLEQRILLEANSK